MGSHAPSVKKSPASQIVGDLYGGGKGPLATSLYSILAPTGESEYDRLARERTIAQIRSGYGARGLAGSGISIEGENRAMADLAAQQEQYQKANALSILGAGTGNPVVTQSTPRGFMGLK